MNNRKIPGLSSDQQNHCIEFGHHRNLFKFVQDEILFSGIFSELIHDVAFGKMVTRIMILRIMDSESFRPLLIKLWDSYPGENIDQKIINKVRTLGNAKRLTLRI